METKYEVEQLRNQAKYYSERSEREYVKLKEDLLEAK